MHVGIQAPIDALEAYGDSDHMRLTEASNLYERWGVEADNIWAGYQSSYSGHVRTPAIVEF